MRPDPPDAAIPPDPDAAAIAQAMRDEPMHELVQPAAQPTDELAELQRFVAGLLTVQQVMETLAVSRRTVSRWVDSGRLHPATRIGGRPRFTADAVKRALVDVELDADTSTDDQ